MVTGYLGWSACNSTCLYWVEGAGTLNLASQNYTGVATRPVVSIPRNEVDIKTNNSDSTVTLNLYKVEYDSDN